MDAPVSGLRFPTLIHKHLLTITIPTVCWTSKGFAGYLPDHRSTLRRCSYCDSHIGAHRADIRHGPDKVV